MKTSESVGVGLNSFSEQRLDGPFATLEAPDGVQVGDSALARPCA